MGNAIDAIFFFASFPIASRITAISAAREKKRNVLRSLAGRCVLQEGPGRGRTLIVTSRPSHNIGTDGDRR